MNLGMIKDKEHWHELELLAIDIAHETREGAPEERAIKIQA